MFFFVAEIEEKVFEVVSYSAGPDNSLVPYRKPNVLKSAERHVRLAPIPWEYRAIQNRLKEKRSLAICDQ